MVYMGCKMGVNCNLNFHELFYLSCYIHFEIVGDPCDLIGFHQWNLFTNRTIFCFKLHVFPSQ